MRREINTLIFSKNRACQLELLLRTLNIPSSVLFACDPEYKSGYQKLMEMYPEVNFIPETNFKEQVIENLRGDYQMYLCDDDVMVEPFKEDCQEFKALKDNKEIICLTLRLAPYYKDAPKMINNTWRWRRYRHGWGYPMSVSAHIFRTEDISYVIHNGIYDIPGNFEKALRSNIPDRPLMICFDKPKIINNLANQVQTVFPYRNMGISVKELNDKFINGYRISSEDIVMKAKENNYCFLMTDYVFEKFE